MAGKIFINYRRDDARDMAACVRDRLAAVFGSPNVFMDVDNLMAGQRFDKELEKALAETDVSLSVIGPKMSRSGYLFHAAVDTARDQSRPIRSRA